MTNFYINKITLKLKNKMSTEKSEQLLIATHDEEIKSKIKLYFKKAKEL